MSGFSTCYQAPIASSMLDVKYSAPVRSSLLMDTTAAWRHSERNTFATSVATAHRSSSITPPMAACSSKEGGIKQFLLHFAGGTMGGMGGILMSYPLDTIKVRMQTTQGIYTGMVDCIQKVIAQEGMRTFYRGINAPLAAYGIIKATTFGVYGNCLDYFAKRAGNPNHTPTFFEIVIAGHLAGFAAAFVMTPADRIKVTMQAARGHGVNPSTWSCAKDIVATQGASSLFRGFSATALRDGPGMALYYIIYDLEKKHIPGWSSENDVKGNPKHTAIQMMMFGGMSGVVSWLPVYPIDVIKSRIQSDATGKKYTSMLDCALKSTLAEGPFVLYRGCLPVLLAAVPLHGTVFMVYELWMQHTKDWL